MIHISTPFTITFPRCLQDLVAQYERIVDEHQTYCKAVMEMQEWLDATNNTVILWSDLDMEKISIENNLKKLKVM